MSVEQTQGRTALEYPVEQQGSWDSGWYLFEDGRVVGPVTANEAFSRPKLSPSGQVRMISRKGFTQWYPIQEFAEIYSMASRYTDHVASRPAPSTVSFNRNSPIARTIGPDAPLVHRSRISTDSYVSEMPLQVRESIPTEATVVHPMTPTISHQKGKIFRYAKKTAAQSEPKKLTRKEKKRLALQQKRAKLAASQPNNLAAGYVAPTTPTVKLNFEQQYLQVSSRLRLGLIASPSLRSFFYMPISLGGYWWVWMSNVSEEISWHLNGASRVNLILPMWMSMIPGVHLILAYLVARMARQMEEQNGYRTVNPLLATIFAIFPPFYMMIIQGALNRHWRLHVNHSAVSNQA